MSGEEVVYRMSSKEKVLLVLSQLFFAAVLIQYNDILTGVIAGLYMLCCVFFTSFREKWELIKKRKPILWMVIFFLWVFISIFTSEDRYEGFRFLDPRLPTLYFPLTLGLVQASKELKERMLLSIAVIVTLYCAACMIWGINNYLETKNTAFLYNDALTVMTDQQSAYISLLVNFSIYIFSCLLFFKNYRYKILLSVGILFLFGMSYMLAGRSMMIMLYLSVFIFVIYYGLKKKKYLESAAIILSIAIGGFLGFKFFPDTFNRFKDIIYTKFQYDSQATESHYSNETTADQWNGANFRLAAWQCGWELFKQYPIAGTGLGDKKAKLLEKYKEKNFIIGLRTKRNVHNNYLDLLLSNGIIGLALFLIAWYILPIREMILTRDYLSLLMMTTFFVAMITEVYLDRSFGGMMFGYFVPLLLIDKNRSQGY